MPRRRSGLRSKGAIRSADEAMDVGSFGEKDWNSHHRVWLNLRLASCRKDEGDAGHCRISSRWDDYRPWKIAKYDPLTSVSFRTRPLPLTNATMSEKAQAAESRAGTILGLTLKLFWFVFAVVVFALFYKPIRYELLPNLSQIKIAGVEASFINQQFDLILSGKCGSPETRDTFHIVTERARTQLIRRARSLSALIEGSTILWIDDNPSYNRCERNILETIGISVDTAVTSDQAGILLAARGYDLVISDVYRQTTPDAGIRFLSSAPFTALDVPLVFYTGSYNEINRGVPRRAYAVAHRPDYLIHFVLDVLERGGVPYPAGVQRVVADTASAGQEPRHYAR